MTYDKIVSDAVALIQDGAYGEDEVADLLSQVAQYIGVKTRIPSTKTIGNLTVLAGGTSTNVRASISGFSYSYISTVKNTTVGEDLTIYPSLELMFAEYETFDEEGDIEAVCFEDFMVWTQKVATEDQILSFIYYQTPTIVSGNTPAPWAPDGLHHDLFVHGAAAIAFGEIEDGVEDSKVNTGYNAGKFLTAINDLSMFYSKSRKHFISGFWSE